MNKVYSIACLIARPFFSLVYRVRAIGRENIPDGATVVCANHSNNSDPVLMVYAFTRRNQMHFMAKSELFKIPILGLLLKAAGIFSVDRSGADMAAIRTAIKFLKSGEKIAMFPEGRRVDADDAAAAKTGAIMLAFRTGSPITPVYIPRKKRFFSRIPVVIGQPYKIEAEGNKLTAADYSRLATELMEKIEELSIKAE